MATPTAIIPKKTTVIVAIRKKVYMILLSIWDVSEKAGELLYTAGYLTLILSGVTAVLGTIWLMWGDASKSKYASIEMQKLKTQAATANLDAAKATGDAAKANDSAAQANKATALLNDRAASLEKDAAVARKEEAVARLDLEKLKASLAWREIDPEQTRKFTSTSATFPKGIVKLSYMANDQEIVSYTNKIGALLQSSGYAASLKSTFVGAGLHTIGLSVASQDPQNAVAIGILTALKSAGIECAASRDADDDEVVIIVGQKPQPK